MSVRPHWHQYFLGIAKAVSARADCSRRQVGCVIVDEDNRIVSTGYNGAPAGDPGCATLGACPRGQQSYEDVPAFVRYDTGTATCVAAHAELNAVIYARRSLKGCRAYITCEPCHNCDIALRAAGITDIYWPKEGTE